MSSSSGCLRERRRRVNALNPGGHTIQLSGDGRFARRESSRRQESATGPRHQRFEGRLALILMKKTGRKIPTVTVAALTLVAALAPSPGDDVLAAQEKDSTTSHPAPPSPPGPEDEEKLYGPSSVPGCDLDFAVLAAAAGEPSTIRECPRADGGRDAYFFPEPVVAPRHVDTVEAGAAGDGGWEVVVRLTDAGARELAAYRDRGLSDPVGVVVDGEVTTEFRLRASPAVAARIVALAGVSRERAERAAAVVRAATARARARWSDRLWRFEWAPRPGGLLDSLYRRARTELAEACPDGDDPDCHRAHHRAREVVLDTLRLDPRATASPHGLLAVRTAVRWDPDAEVAAAGLDLVFRAPDAVEAGMLRSLGEWAYGVSWHVPSRRNGWVPIPGTGGWLNTAAGRIRGRVTPADGDLVTLDESVRGRRVPASGQGSTTGGEMRVPAGSYVVTATGDGAVWLRAERPGDFELGCRGFEDTTAADGRSDSAVFRVEIPHLYRPADGTPVIRLTYPRGC